MEFHTFTFLQDEGEDAIIQSVAVFLRCSTAMYAISFRRERAFENDCKAHIWLTIDLL